MCSPELAATRRHQRPDLVTISNAVDVDHFTRQQPRPVDLPPSPVAVYVGTLHADRLDVDLVTQLAANQPELAVALVGPNALTDHSSQQLNALPNVHLLGPRPYAEVPGYVQHADVIVVPHMVTPFTESLDPIKAYECVAVGRPTVATEVAGFRGVGEPIHAVGASIRRRGRDRSRRSSPSLLPGRAVVDRTRQRLRASAAARSRARRGRRRRRRRTKEPGPSSRLHRPLRTTLQVASSPFSAYCPHSKGSRSA